MRRAAARPPGRGREEEARQRGGGRCAIPQRGGGAAEKFPGHYARSPHSARPGRQVRNRGIVVG